MTGISSFVPPFEADLYWLQFAYIADRARAYVAPASTVLVPSAVAERDEFFWRCSPTSGDNILRCTAADLLRLGRLSAGRHPSEWGKE